MNRRGPLPHGHAVAAKAERTLRKRAGRVGRAAMVQAGVLQAAGDRTLRPQQVGARHHGGVARRHRPRHVAAQRPLPRKQVREREVPFGGRQQRAARLVGLDRVARGLLRDVALEPTKARKFTSRRGLNSPKAEMRG